MKMTQENLIKAGYNKFTDELSKSRNPENYICSYQKRFDDEKGKKYFITLDCYDMTSIYSKANVKINPISFSVKTQFNTKNGETFNVDYFIKTDETEIENMEKFYENMFQVLKLEYYEVLY